jgi:competence protein ComEC
MVETRGGVIRSVAAPFAGALCGGLSTRVLAPSASQAEELAELLDGVYAAEEAEFWSRLDCLDARMNNFSHHGQRDGVSAEQLRAIAPKAVVCCASSDQRYNSADPGVLTMAAKGGARLYFSDCPPVPGEAEPLPPHHALEFTIGPGGVVEGRYLPL